jgi:hypothetical protein
MKETKKIRLVDFFKEGETFSRKELLDYFIESEGDMKESTFAWRIHDLKRTAVLIEIRRGLYSFNTKPRYQPVPDKKIEKIVRVFRRSFRNVQYCVWDVNWINEFTLHQFSNNTCLFETEKDLQESVWHTFSDNGFKNLLWSLNGSHLTISGSVEPIVIIPLITRAPVQEIITAEGRSVILPTLEKILVDIYEDINIFHFIQGAELERIFANALDRYAVNYSTLFAYARRRGKAPSLHAFLSKQFPKLKNNFT